MDVDVDDDGSSDSLKSTWNERYFEIENECNILRSRLKLKEEEIGGMSKELQSQKKMNNRMKSLFGKKAGEYRERVYQMTGFNVCLLGDGKTFRLRHVWMGEPEDEIVLQIDKLGMLAIKESRFLRSVDKSLLNKFTQSRSLPLFLSELTIWLYNED